MSNAGQLLGASRLEADTLRERVAEVEAQRDELRRELAHIVRLMEPLEHGGSLRVPGLATLNSARIALSNSPADVIPFPFRTEAA